MRKIIILILVLLTIIYGGCTRQYGRKEQHAEAADKKEISLCSSLGENITTLLAEGFAAKSGTEVNIQYLPSGSFSERMDFLRQNKFDCWLGGTAEEYYLATRQNLLYPYLAKEAYKVPAELRNKQGFWTSLYLRYIAFISNKDNLTYFSIYAPDTWDELLQPVLKGEIVMTDLAQGGVSYGMLTSIWQMRGRKKALSFAGKLNKQQVVYTSAIVDAVDMVYRGDKTIAVVPLDYALILEGKHRHLFATVIKDANRNLLTGAAVMAGSSNIPQAEEFLDYLMSDDSEKLLNENGYHYMWHVKNYPYNDGRRELIGDVRVPVDDLSWTAVDKNEIIREWLKAR